MSEGRNNYRLSLDTDEQGMIDSIAKRMEEEFNLPMKYGGKRNIIQTVRYCIRRTFNEMCHES